MTTPTPSHRTRRRAPRTLATTLALTTLALTLATAPLRPAHADSPKPSDSVNPFMGTDAHGHTFPGASAPFGMRTHA